MSDEKSSPFSSVESFRSLEDVKHLRSQRPLDNKPADTKPVHVGPATGVIPGPAKDPPKKKK